MVARGLAVLVAIIVAGWFGLSARQAHDISAAEGILANVSNPNPGQARHVTALLRSAATLNPDLEVDVLRGDLAAGEGERERASQIFSSVTRREPLNLEAWYDLANVTTDHHSLSLALRQIAALAPDVAKHK